MQQYLAPGHRLTGASVPALGGMLQRVTRESDGRELLARSAGSEYPGEGAVRHLDAELGAAVGVDGERMLRPSLRIDGDRQSWLLYESLGGHPLDTSRAWSLSEFWDIAEA